MKTMVNPNKQNHCLPKGEECQVYFLSRSIELPYNCPPPGHALVGQPDSGPTTSGQGPHLDLLY